MAKAAKSNVFNTSGASTSKSKNPIIEANCAKDIDQFVELKQKIKDLEGQLKLHEATIHAEAKKVFAERAFAGNTENIKLQGNQHVVTWITQDRSSGFKDGDRDSFCEAHGNKATETLLEIDYSTFRLNPEAFENEQHREKIVKAFEKLQNEIGINILVPGVYKATENAVIKARDFAKNAKDLQEIIEDLKLINQLRS